MSSIRTLTFEEITKVSGGEGMVQNGPGINVMPL